ncbi:hypothetical protein SLEP1_g29530 [Rubroshorea leprosula]|uniref:Uncharacterized protein n=1 Tax=Rubroshorea leprosula TaxID=152421 RepID=A0AAV5K3B1_9ROSI|nr:hypothetical protein SLEP1_g29530 [Rubroshorea leprosula]
MKEEGTDLERKWEESHPASGGTRGLGPPLHFMSFGSKRRRLFIRFTSLTLWSLTLIHVGQKLNYDNVHSSIGRDVSQSSKA